jgi:hypothetical protein
MSELSPHEVEAWASRVQAYEGATAYRRILTELSVDRDYAAALLERLADHRDPIVRSWAGTAAMEILGRGAVPLLFRLTNDRDGDVRDGAREDLIAIDPDFVQQMLPSLRQVLKRGKDPFGEDKAAMWRLARLRDPESVSILREYASRNDPRDYAYRMPLVLADYIEDPTSIARRIRDHDHEWMFWLVDAASLLPVPDSAGSFAAARGLPVDRACLDIIDNRPQKLPDANVPVDEIGDV